MYLKHVKFGKMKKFNISKWLLDNNILIDLSSLTSYHMFNLV